MSEMKPDIPGVIALPPLLYAIPWLVSVGLHALYPVHVLANRPARVIGGVGTALAIALALWGGRTMHRAETDPNPFHPATALVVDGPFRWSRNPLYVSLTLFYVGLTLLVNALWPLVLLPAILVVVQKGVVEREERYLERKFGARYQAYRA